MMNSILPLVSSEDLSRYPDQASYKINLIVERMNEIWQVVYPVGSYYETSDNDFDPVKTWGGDWEEVSPGRWHRVA